MSDQLGPWMIDPENTEGRYLVFDNLYNEMRLMGGVKKVEPTDRICTTHDSTSDIESTTCDQWAVTSSFETCVLIDVVRVPKADA